MRILTYPLMLGLAGCTAHIPQVEPIAGVAVPEAFVAPARPQPGTDDRWWAGFEDEELNSLIERALARNQQIEAARQRLAAAAEIVRAERSDYFPTVDAELSASASDVARGGNFDRFEGALFAPFSLDLNGRLSAELAAATAEADAAAYFLADQQRLVAAAVANQFIEYRRTGARLKLLDQSIGLQEQTLQIVRLRYEAGLSSNLDLRRAQADLSRTRSQQGLLELARARAANALSVLLGEPPAEIASLAGEDVIPRYTGGPDVGVPADLLRRRPDLLLAEAELASAAAQVGIERADLLPSLQLSGSLLSGGSDIDRIVSNIVANVGALIGIPLFDAGRRSAEVEAAKRELDARMADYRNSLLQVFSEVETTLVAIDAFGDRTTELGLAVEQSEAAFEQSDALYREGLASLFDVLDVQRQLISSREALIDGQAALAQSHVDLYAAIGSRPI